MSDGPYKKPRGQRMKFRSLYVSPEPMTIQIIAVVPDTWIFQANAFVRFQVFKTQSRIGNGK